MVLVRKTEIGCRNGWAQDLWEPAPGLSGDADGASDHIPDPSQIPTSLPGGLAVDRDQPPAASGEMFTDKLTSITIAGPRSTPTSETPDSDQPPAPIDRSDVRAARRRRVEQLERDRQQQQRDRSDEARKLLDASADAKPAPVRSVTDAGRGVRPSQSQNLGARPNRPTTPSANPQPPGAAPATPLRATITERAPLRPMAEIQPPRPPAGGASRDASVSFGASPSSFRDTRGPGPVKSSERQIAKQPASSDALLRWETDPLPVAEVQAQLHLQPSRSEQRSNVPASPPARSRVSASQPEPEPPIGERDPGWMVWAGQIEDGRPRDPVLDQPSQPAEQPLESLPAAMTVDPIDSASGTRKMPQCCATCRDFRPVGDGASGWCANPHAFSTKRMVESSDLACRSSVGSWWLPNDEVWLDHADTTHHSRPTPLLDELRKPNIERDREMPSHPS